MAYEVDEEVHVGSTLPGVSGAAVHALIALIRDESGDAGVAQALALAAEDRSFAALSDVRRWMPLADAVALFAAGALVTGDGAIAMHVGGDLLWVDDAPNQVKRVRSLGSPETAYQHIGALISRFEGAAEAVTLEVTSGRALVQISPVGTTTRHAYLCELSRGLLGELPALFDRDPAVVTEHECAARGGRACRYVVQWSNAPGEWTHTSAAAVSTGTHRANRSSEAPITTVERPGQAQPVHPGDNGEPQFGSPGNGWASGWAEQRASESPDGFADGPSFRSSGSTNGTTNGHSPVSEAYRFTGTGRDVPSDHYADVEILTKQLSAARSALVETAAEAARWEAAAEASRTGSEALITQSRAEAAAAVEQSRMVLARLEQLLEGTSAALPGLIGNDLESLLALLAERADKVIDADQFLLVLRPLRGLPIELHYRGLDDDDATALAARLWSQRDDENSDRSLHIVEINSPLRAYGRLAVFADPARLHSSDNDRALRMFARYAANILDVHAVLDDVRRSDSTARTILSFSERLSGLTNLIQALQLLADTVPEVTDCNQSTVYLWDPDRSRLVFGASTAGVDAPDADFAPFAPHWAAAAAARTSRTDYRDSGDAPTSEHNAALRVEVDDPLIRKLITGHGVMVLDSTQVSDPILRGLMEESDVPASVVAPLFASGDFLGVIAANFDTDSLATIHDPDLHERLAGLADQAATAILNLELLEAVSHMAWHDALTGLPNRRLFEDRVEQELMRSRRVGEPVCMFFVDLDNFKTVNDTFGHATGDVLIKEVGQRLIETVRGQDTVARVGGDEFAILLPGLVDQLSINQLAERTLDAMHTPFDIFGERVTTSASIGIAIAPEHGDTYDDLLNRADEAMYRAKDLGRNAFEMFQTSPGPAQPGRRSIDERQLHADLINALDADEFFLCYQPYFDLRTAEVVGVEALIRWQHPTHGVLDPPQFIPMAEKSDLIVALDNWVLWQGCRQLRTWQDHGVGPLRLSVNIASRDLANSDFYESVARTLRDTGIDPALLELEITERVVLDKMGPAAENIERLRKLGVRFTIDDFGSGNSSLDRIGSFPVSTLKIDQSFVQVLGPADGEHELVGAIIAMAAKLGLSCVAEGVETLQQSRVLLQRGCTTAQGYFFSPPLAPEGIEDMLNSLTPAEIPDSFGEPPPGVMPPDQSNS